MTNKLPPVAGRLLISEPFMMDSNFKRSVIYLTQHGAEGTTGFVLNQRYEGVLGDLIPELAYSEIPVYIGGPVEMDTLHFLHSCPNKIEGGIELEEGLFWGGNFEQVIDMAKTGLVDNLEVKFFVGYSGWSPGQLDKEITENTWITAELPDRSVLFQQAENELWKQMIRGLGTRYAHIANFPENPLLN